MSGLTPFMKDILALFVKISFILCALFGMAAFLLLLVGLILWRRELLTLAAICFCSSIVLFFSALLAAAIEEDLD